MASYSRVQNFEPKTMPEEEIVSIANRLREILVWLDAHELPIAAIHVNQAIEVLVPTSSALFHSES
jgi:hypothetical protein